MQVIRLGLVGQKLFRGIGKVGVDAVIDVWITWLGCNWLSVIA